MSDTWQLKNRIELSGYSKEVSETAYGYVLYQDISCSPFRLPLTLTARFALFETESYNARIYTYESDVLHAFSIPALYDKGSRFYLLAKYELKNDVTCWVRFAQTWYSQKTEIGSGLDRIDGNTKSEVKVQLRWKF